MSDNPDMQLGVEFFMQARENKRKSAEEKRPIFDDLEYVRIVFPGDSKRTRVAPANEKHYVSHAGQQMTYAERFPASYAAFKDGQDNFVSGTPLSQLPALTEARRAELKALKVVTVEQLAGMPDNTIKKIGFGGREMVESARAFLDAAKGTAEVDDLRRQLEEMKALIDGQTAPVANDEFADYSDEDLKNMIKDAGGDLPKGRATRETLAGRLREIAAQKEVA